MFKIDRESMRDIVSECHKIQGGDGCVDDGNRIIYNDFIYSFDYYRISIHEYNDGGNVGDELEYIEINYINHTSTYCDIVEMLVNSEKYKGMRDIFSDENLELIIYHDEDLSKEEYNDMIDNLGLEYYKKYNRIKCAEDIKMSSNHREMWHQLFEVK